MNAKRTILIVDDDPKVRKTLSDILRVRGYAPIAAATGKAALDRVEEETPAVALIDLKLEDISGLEVMRGIKECSPGTECIVLTGYATQASAIEAVNLGAYSYVQKPYDVEQLLVTVRRAIEKREAAEALRESEQEKSLVLSSLSELVTHQDKDLRVIWANRAAAESVDSLPEQLVGLHCYEIWHGRSEPCVGCPVIKAIETGQLQEAEITTPDGRVWFIRGCPVREASSDISGAVEVMLEITERKRAQEEIRRHLERIEVLREIDRAITSTLDLTGVLDIILEELERVLPYHSAAVFLLSDGTARLAAGRGFPDMERALQVSFPVKEDALTREVLQEKRPLALADAQADERFLSRGGTEYARSWIGVPLIAKGGTVGFLTIDHREPGVYDEESAETAEAFASQVAIAIENARLYEEAQRELAERKRAEEELQRTLEKLREALGGIIQTVALTVETKDPYTAGHQRRVANLARAIATEMGLSPEQIEGIRMAGGIHDIGKISIPAAILSKPTRLTEFEWGIIKMHSQVGYDILKKIEFPWPVAQIVLQHHERLDGSGYPQGLSGKDILMKARILAVADVVEAMASFRPYRPARGIDKALEEISQNRGILYDADAVDACLKLFTENGFEFE